MDVVALIVGVVGAVAGVVGLGVAWIQTRRVARVEDLRQRQLISLLVQLQTLMNPAATGGDGREPLSSLYISLVQHYLQGEPTFSFDRLAAAIDDGLISGDDQVAVWRALISQRQENASVSLRHSPPSTSQLKGGAVPPGLSAPVQRRKLP